MIPYHLLPEALQRFLLLFVVFIDPTYKKKAQRIISLALPRRNFNCSCGHGLSWHEFTCGIISCRAQDHGAAIMDGLRVGRH